MNIKVLFSSFVCIILFNLCTIEQKSSIVGQQNNVVCKILSDSCNKKDSLIFLKGDITQDFLGEKNKLSISDSCLSFLPKYFNHNLMFYSGVFQGEGLITILYKIEGDTAKDILYHPGKLVEYDISDNNLLYMIYSEDCCAGINVREHEFLLNSDLKPQRLHSIYSIKGTHKPINIEKKEEFIVQQETIQLRLAPTTQLEFNFDTQTEDNIIALFAKGSKGYILADSVNYIDNQHWYYVELVDLPVFKTHFWDYENNDSTNISFIGWIDMY